LRRQEVHELQRAEGAIVQARNGDMPANHLHQSYCYVHCVLESVHEAADVDGGLACPVCPMAQEGGVP
jgi:hypothetical protein